MLHPIRIVKLILSMSDGRFISVQWRSTLLVVRLIVVDDGEVTSMHDSEVTSMHDSEVTSMHGGVVTSINWLEEDSRFLSS